jgi:uncharacterized membrane protein
MSLEDLSLEARDELAALARQLAENPETRKDFLRLTKRAKPDMPIPELDIEATTNSALQKAEQRIMQMEAKQREKDAKEELEKRRSKIKQRGLDDSDVAEIEKLMLEKGMTNHDTAAEYWEWMKRSATPTPSGYNPNPMTKFDLGKYWKNPVQGARDEAAKALNELRKNPRPIGL